MKIIFIVLLSFFIPAYSYSQPFENDLLLDERGKYIYYEVVDVPQISKDSLSKRSLYFFKKKNLKLKTSFLQADSLLNGAGKFILNKEALVLSHPKGEMVFTFTCEIKEGKYRYWLTDFKFLPYQRDRYGNFVPLITNYTPLEKDPGKLNALEWKNTIGTTAEQSKKIGESFKKYLAGEYSTSENTNKSKTLIGKDW
ncbi:DUF4468 domain-containing protein [Daejeonella oryzae]|uniref:DUF4468 domain-containing protein n=1 Tax=Daejeonella oryzae TaxID=1122943 RepID=UPI0006871992|nr:DUF4468 domain-containing protein [Daejeonella oryzae]